MKQKVRNRNNKIQRSLDGEIKRGYRKEEWGKVKKPISKKKKTIWGGQ